MKKELPTVISKKDQVKFVGLFIVLGLIISITYNTFTYLQKRNIENSQVKVIKGKETDDPLSEYRGEFKYIPNFEDFFEVEDELDENIKYTKSEGELNIRNYLGGLLYRAYPRLIQKVAAPAVYQTLIGDSNPNKGKVLWVYGKVLGISTAPREDAILSAQFVYSYLIETADGSKFECLSIRELEETRIGDIIYMNGIYLKLKKQTSDKVITPVLLGNSIQILLPKPAIWETKEIYAKHLSGVNKKNNDLIDIPPAVNLSNWVTKNEKELIDNDVVWSKINDKLEEDSQKLEPELELKIIQDLSNVSNKVILDLVDNNIKKDDLLQNIELHRRKIIKIVGKLESISEAILPEPINGLEKVYYSKVKDLKGDSYYFSFLSPKFMDQADRLIWQDPNGLLPKEGDIVICSGVFVQLVKEGENNFPLVYGKIMGDLAEYAAIWDPVDHGGDRNVTSKFGRFYDAGFIEKAPLNYLFAKVSYTNSKTIKSAYESTPEFDKINFVKMMKNPELITDMPFSRFGIMKKITKIEGTLYYDFHGVKDVYEIYFIDEDKNLFSFVSLNLPDGAEMNKRMTFVGYFLKRSAFRNADNNITWSPYLVGYIDSVEVEIVKVMSPTEKMILAIIVVLSFAFVGYLNYKYFFPDKKVNKLRSESHEHAKLIRENLRLLASADKKLNEILITHFHHSLVEEMPVPIELCQSINHWPKLEEGNTHTLLRPEYLKAEFEAIIRHLSEFKTDIPRDIKAAFFNKRKELLGLRTFQVSKFEIPDLEKKRGDCFLVVPLDFILHCPENLDHLDGYLDQYGLPPWHTWVHIGKIPKFILRNSSTGYTPETMALISFLPIWMADRAKEHFRVVIKEKVIKDTNEKNEV